MHQVLGVVIFSSLLFIGVKDLIPVIIRFGFSATTAQYIRVFEISGLLASTEQNNDDRILSLDQFRHSRSISKRKGPPKVDRIRAIIPPQSTPLKTPPDVPHKPLESVAARGLTGHNLERKHVGVSGQSLQPRDGLGKEHAGGELTPPQTEHNRKPGSSNEQSHT